MSRFTTAGLIYEDVGNDSILRALGKFCGRLSRVDAVFNEDVYVIGGQRRSLLSRRACEALDLVRRVSVDSGDSGDSRAVQSRTPEVVCRLGI